MGFPVPPVLALLLELLSQILELLSQILELLSQILELLSQILLQSFLIQPLPEQIFLCA